VKNVDLWTRLDELAALHDVDVDASHAEGLRCRPIAQTVTDTWAWMQTAPRSAYVHPRATVGFDADAEQRLLDLADA
jgi:hypothetical protein